MGKLKKVAYFLQKWDGVWSLPLLIGLFILIALFGQSIFGNWFIPMPLDDLHSAMEAGIIVIAANTIALLGMRFNFKELFRYYHNTSKQDLQKLHAWQRLLILSAVYLLYFVAFILVWHKIVSAVHILPS